MKGLRFLGRGNRPCVVFHSTFSVTQFSALTQTSPGVSKTIHTCHYNEPSDHLQGIECQVGVRVQYVQSRVEIQPGLRPTLDVDAPGHKLIEHR